MSLFCIIMGVIGILASLTLLFLLALFLFESCKEFKERKRADTAHENL